MLDGLSACQVTASDELGDEGVVLGDGPQVATFEEVRPGVADVRYLRDRLPILYAEAHRHHRRPHPREPVVPPGGREDAPVCLSYGFLQRGRGLEVFEDIDGDGACDLPGLEAADAV